MSTRRLTFEVTAHLEAAADTETRRVSGMIVPYGTPGRTSIGEVSIRPGAIRVPDPASRVRLLYGHDRDAPIGVAAELEDREDGLYGTFLVARTPLGDTYLAELDPATPIRDGLSIELDDIELNGAQVVAGSLIAVAGVPLPAYTDARAALAAEHKEEPPMSEPTVAPDPAVAPEPAPTPTPDAPTTLDASAHARPMTAAPARTAPVSALVELTRRFTAARLEGATAMRAALADITPAGNGAGNGDAGLTMQALGELWSGVEYVDRYRPLVVGGPLTGVRVNGFRWNPAPVVADYSGNKAEVPTNPAKLEYVEESPTRIAGAHDIDRIYRDLGNDVVLRSYWARMAESLAVQLDARALAAILAASAPAQAATSAMAAIIKGTLAVSAVGTPSYALVASDLIESMALTPALDAPVGPPMPLPPIVAAPELPAGVVIVGARPAVRQLTFTPPVRVEAVNVPNGGIDAGLFSYSLELVENAAGVVRYNVAAAKATAA